MSNKNDIYYKKYIKYKMKYLNLLSFLKNNAKVSIEDSKLSYDDLDKINKNTIKNKPNNIENSDRTVMSVESVDSIEYINSNEPFDKQSNENKIEDPNVLNILDKFKSIKNKLDDEEYNKLLSVLSEKLTQKKNNYSTQNFDINEIIYIKKLTSGEKKLLKFITELELNILKKHSCKLIKDKILTSIQNKTCLDNNILDDIWKNLIIIDEELECGFDDNETNIFNEYLEKSPCE
jgi:hypothetical protein